MNPGDFGPVYCETPLTFSDFPLEPVNAFSNLLTITFGVVAITILRRRAPRAHDLYLLALLMVVNGIGSLLWHGLRTPWALTLDFVSGFLFLIIFLFLWARRLWGMYGGLAALAAFTVCTYAGIQLVGVNNENGPPRLMVGIVLTVVIALALATWQRLRDRHSIVLAGAALIAALLAFTMRTIDLGVCDVIAVGTHSLWQVFLSTGSFLCILFLMRLDKVR